MATLNIDDILEDDLTFSFSRSGGPGGQNVNKVNTRVTMWFDLVNTNLFTDAQKQEICKSFPSRVTKDGKFLIVSQRHRSQTANREEAKLRLVELLNLALSKKPVRRETRIPRHERERRLKEKKHQSEIKKQRSKPEFNRD